MPEYTFDPAVGGVIETRGGVPLGQSQEYMPDAPTFAEAEAATFARNVKGLSARHQHSSVVGDTADIAMEQKLLHLQNRLAKGDFSNELERMQIEHLTVQMAQNLTGGGEAIINQDPVIQQSAPSPADAADQYAADLAESGAHDADLQFAAQNLDTEVCEVINDSIAEAESPEVIGQTMSALNQIRNQPEMVGEGDPTVISQGVIQELADNYGNEIANDIATLNGNLAAGNISKAQALSTAMRNPKLVTSMLDAASKGLIKLAL